MGWRGGGGRALDSGPCGGRPQSGVSTGGLGAQESSGQGGAQSD